MIDPKGEPPHRHPNRCDRFQRDLAAPHQTSEKGRDAQEDGGLDTARCKT
jgi:hypothetical protein